MLCACVVFSWSVKLGNSVSEFMLENWLALLFLLLISFNEGISRMLEQSKEFVLFGPYPIQKQCDIKHQFVPGMFSKAVYLDVGVELSLTQQQQQKCVQRPLL